jgi:hypothetical protein
LVKLLTTHLYRLSAKNSRPTGGGNKIAEIDGAQFGKGSAIQASIMQSSGCLQL